MVKKRRRYTREFKLEAVRLALESERPLAEVARELGIAPNVLHRWKQQLETRDPATAFPGHGKRAGPEDEVWQLCRELEQVKQERDFLKKAVVDSAGHCNTLYYFTDLEGVVHGTVRTSWPFRDPEGGVVATLEKGRVAE